MGLHSFTKADRLLKRSEFLRLSKGGQRIHTRHFIAFLSPGLHDQTRLGVTVSKRVGHAVTRNRIKRWTREYFRLNRHKVRGAWDINIVAKKEAAGLPSQQVFSSLERIFDRIA
jgi:ribonuclease P protein component